MRAVAWPISRLAAGVMRCHVTVLMNLPTLKPPEYRAAPRVGSRPLPEDAVREIENQQQRDAARESVGELDERRGRRRSRHHLAVAERPVGAAASTGPAGTDIGSPKDYEDVPGEDHPGIKGESRICGVQASG